MGERRKREYHTAPAQTAEGEELLLEARDKKVSGCTPAPAPQQWRGKTENRAGESGTMAKIGQVSEF